ncbi:DNA polymerase III subunit delta [Chelativorans sp. M5D2P16]|uniref:DNA polymerase III subunit delta n=1 Tax=Chelativorans sp. M5D2P16 TaxID=3095678 RepID=UPI002ACAD067|nr:DNA polymerase III subunit delta [Chelativorans sp. M5D2P16]MDZ5697420.1 DNA polymerase III subunit delta [Chelativorans sp. M5D2P16]
MAQKKAHEVDGWLARPDPATSVVLVYGPDRGLVSERAAAFARGSGLPLDDPFTVVRIDAAEAEAAGRLLDEARTVPMFADRRLVWLRGAANNAALTSAISALIADPPEGCLILVEAGDLKKGTALRSAAESGKSAIALPCYTDDARGVDAVIDEVLGAAGLSIALDARQLLKANLGGDRLATRSELEKLALYCAGMSEVRAEDVRASIGDASKLSADDAVDAVMCGRIAEFDTLFARHLASGSPPFLVLSAALRHVQTLQLMRAQMEAQGKTPAAAVASARPPVFFARRRMVEQALQHWNRKMLEAAADRLHRAILKSRQHQAVAEPVSRQALLALAIEGARAAR